MRYLTENEYEHDIFNRAIFKTSRDVPKTKRLELKKMGKGNKPNHAEPLSPDEERLWTSGILDVNSCNPATLQNTMWFWNAKLLGLRGADEHRQMQWGDLTLETDINNKQ